jgi:selenoprotein W-related protein
LAEAIVTRFRPTVKQSHPVAQVILVPSGGGIFDVEADGEVIYSKSETGRHAEHGEVIASIQRLLG